MRPDVLPGLDEGSLEELVPTALRAGGFMVDASKPEERAGRKVWRASMTLDGRAREAAIVVWWCPEQKRTAAIYVVSMGGAPIADGVDLALTGRCLGPDDKAPPIPRCARGTSDAGAFARVDPEGRSAWAALALVACASAPALPAEAIAALEGLGRASRRAARRASRRRGSERHGDRRGAGGGSRDGGGAIRSRRCSASTAWRTASSTAASTRSSRMRSRSPRGRARRRAASAGAERAEAEQALARRQMAVIGLSQLVLAHPEQRDAFLPAIRRAAAALVTEETLAFTTRIWAGERGLASLGGPHGHAYLGYLAMSLGFEAAVDPGSPRLPLARALADALARRLDAARFGVIETYPGETYPPDVAVVLGGIALCDRATGDRHAASLSRAVAAIRSRFVDAGSGYLVQKASTAATGALERRAARLGDGAGGVRRGRSWTPAARALDGALGGGPAASASSGSAGSRSTRPARAAPATRTRGR